MEPDFFEETPRCVLFRKRIKKVRQYFIEFTVFS